jgi:hypothetical protein
MEIAAQSNGRRQGRTGGWLNGGVRWHWRRLSRRPERPATGLGWHMLKQPDFVRPSRGRYSHAMNRPQREDTRPRIRSAAHLLHAKNDGGATSPGDV